MYRYQALNSARQQIRLIRLEKGSSRLAPRRSIHTIDLALAPKYIALSYTWGPPGPSRQISVDGKAFRVRENLYNFLCSSQAGSAERNSQVRLMPDIYTDPKMVRAAYALDDDMENADELYVPTANIRTLLSSEYFTRIWIVQEVSLARSIRILIGDYELRWAAARFLAERIDPMKPVNSLRTLNDLFKENKRKQKRQLDEVVGKYSVHECQDPRDKVYGFLGMIPASQRPVVDYAKSTHQVFLDVIPINMLRLAWNMKFPDHDQRGLISLFQEIADVEDELSKDLDSQLTLTSVIDGFGYDIFDPPVTDEHEGVLMGSWWMKLGDKKYYYGCRTSAQPLRQLFDWKFLGNVQSIRIDPGPGREVQEATVGLQKS
ncbi:HET-domain-containing protein [Nemania serpens]|nr:HET-domain-containing protein [Nemania serpens]